VKINKLTCAAEVKFLLGEGLSFGGGERMGVVLDNIGAVGLPKH
jgi:hypothetical protein